MIRFTAGFLFAVWVFYAGWVFFGAGLVTGALVAWLVTRQRRALPPSRVWSERELRQRIASL